MKPALSSPFRKWIQVLFCAFIIVGLLAGLRWIGVAERLEWPVQDQLQRIAAQAEKPDPNLCFVVLDQRSLDAAEAEFSLGWPWPRESYAQAIDFLQNAGARAIILDFLFTEPSLYGPEDDRTLADALQQAGNVFLPVVVRELGPQGEVSLLNRERPDAWLHPDVRPDALLAVQHSLDLPVTPVLKQAAGFGYANFTPDADGVLRRIKPCLAVGDACLGPLGLAPLRFVPKPGRIVLGRGQLGIGDTAWPLDRQGNLVLRYPGSWEKYPRTSLIDCITSNVALKEGKAPAVNPELFRNKVVVIGSTAPGLMDLRKTPLDSQVPGFFINAAVWAAFSQASAWDESQRAAAAWPLLILAALLGSFWGTRSFARGLAGMAASLVALLAGLLGLFFLRSVSWELAQPAIALLAGYGVSLGWSYRREQGQKQFIQGAFSQILSHTVLDELVKDPRKLAAGGELAEVSVYFSDLEGFTSFSEKLSPQELVKLLNAYLGEMIDTIVEEHQGYVDKFIGDAVMAFWNAPVPNPDHARTACLAAWHGQQKMAQLQERFRELGLEKPLRMRVGIHTGPAVVGMMGSPKKLNYTVIGDTVNLASRLEGVNKQFGTLIMASEDTIRSAGGAVVSREIDRIRVKGKTQPTRVFEIVGLPGEIAPDLQACLDAFQAGTKLFWSRKFKLALEKFKAAAKARPCDEPSQIFIQRCRQFMRKPPARGWDGVTTLTKK